jgi:regulator of replication initiation timing
MGIFDAFEKLINEHGSATILRERLGLIKTQYEELERKNSDLKSENETLRFQVEQLKKQIGMLESDLAQFHDDNPSAYRCDHCGSPNLKRTGSRPDPTFHAVGVKQAIYKCNACGKESYETIDP